ncbi:MAG TPA: Ig-like domain repeat protein [Solirubrobacterales bacterium]|nr:Ig-like domain repeat protein [Solirubrobacterales bacterium]
MAAAEPIEDTTPPQILGLSIEPGEVDVTNSSQTVTITARVTDDLSGLVNGDAGFASPANSQSAIGGLERISGTDMDGVYRTQVTVPRFAESGTWLAFLHFRDRAGNWVEITPKKLEEAGLPSALQVNAATVPVVSSVTPASGPESGGTQVEISGSGFTRVTGVTFGSVDAASFTVNSPTSITATTPPGSGSVDIVVSVSGGNSEATSADRFRYSPPVSLNSSFNPSFPGSKVTFTARVSPRAANAGTPTGSIEFLDGPTPLGVVTLSEGAATLTSSSLSDGTHKIIARYSGDSVFGPGESPELTQAVKSNVTSLDLASTLNPAPYGSSGRLEATVRTTFGSSPPSGSVTFSEGTTVLAVVTLTEGRAIYSLKQLAPGVRDITARYSGDGNYEGSSAVISQTITKAASSLTLTSSRNPAPSNSSFSLKASVKSTAPGNPTGSIVFSQGTKVLASVPIAGSSARYSMKGLPPGTYEITATYTGDANNEGSAGSIVQLVTP